MVQESCACEQCLVRTDAPRGWPYFLTQQRIAFIEEKLMATMTIGQPFLRSRYSLRNLAEDTDIQLHHLSAYFNRILAVSYPDFINHQRVEYCRRLITKGGCAQYNLLGLAKACGFGNRNSLTTAFQKFTGYSPSAYARLMHTWSTPVKT